MSTKRPKSISVRELSKTVDAAVKAVADKHNLKFEPGLVVDWTILGRILRELEGVNVGTVNQAAAELTKSIGGAHADLAHGPGGGLEPAVFGRGGILICGFIAANAIEFRE
jgi:hypothetical protein